MRRISQERRIRVKPNAKGSKASKRDDANLRDLIQRIALDNRHSAELELDAAIAGLGVICTFEAFLSEALGRGQLREALADWRQSFSGPFLLLTQPQQAGAAHGVRGFHPQGRRVEPGLISNQ